jgi:hypothetical protein
MHEYALRRVFMRVFVMDMSPLLAAPKCMRANEMALATGDVRNAEVGSSSLLPSTIFWSEIPQKFGESRCPFSDVARGRPRGRLAGDFLTV